MDSISIDNVFDIWKNKIYLYLNKLENDKEINFENKDKYCLLNALNKSNFKINSQKCINCKELTTFLNNFKIKDNEKIKIKNGKYNGKFLIINRYNYTNFIIKNISKENYPIKDKNLNYCICSILINPNFKYFYICGGFLNVIEIYNNEKNLNELNKNKFFLDKDKNIRSDILKNIIEQIIYLFKINNKYKFTHNEASIDCIKYNYKTFEYIINNKKIISPIKIKIIPSSYSSITYKGKRFFNGRYKNKLINYNIIESWNVKYSSKHKNYTKGKKFFKESFDKYLEGRIIYYKLGDMIDNFIYLRRHYGITKLYSSFDFICIFVSLMLENKFRKIILNDNYLNNIWNNLWLYPNKINNEIINYKGNNTFENIKNIIKNHYIFYE